MTKILVTGGTGFIGSHLVSELVNRGESVRVFDNNFRGKYENIKPLESKIEFVRGDIRDFEDVKRAVEGMETVYHLAYINGTEKFYSHPDLVLDVGIKGTINILDAAKDAGVKEFIYASSSEVYQIPEVFPTPEDVPLIVPDVKNPRYSYGGGKILGELMTLHYAKAEDFKRVIFRPHNIYGPCMGWEHVIPQIVEMIGKASNGFQNKKGEIEIQGEGTESRAFCFVDDAVDGIVLCAKKGADGEIYHVGKDEEITISELVARIADILQIEVVTKSAHLMKGSAPRRCPNISKLKALGYEPKISLKEGLTKTVQWYREKLING
jgi:nucleoside-diphosphate-sugar epimerase